VELQELDGVTETVQKNTEEAISDIAVEQSIAAVDVLENDTVQTSTGTSSVGRETIEHVAVDYRETMTELENKIVTQAVASNAVILINEFTPASRLELGLKNCRNPI